MSKKMWRAPVLAGLVLLGAALPAQATLVTWTLNNVTFDDGGTASGWIEFDAATQSSTSYNVSLTAGSVLPAFTFVHANSYLSNVGAYGPNSFYFWESGTGATEPRTFNLSFATPLGDEGGTHELLTAYSYDCANCTFRMVTGGSLTAPAAVGNGVPEPATLGLMVPALGMLGWMARRRKQKAA